MNKKLIAMAVASAVAAPVVASADVTVYGRINNAISIRDSGATNNTDISNVSSRFGIRASADLGNGLTATGRYEFATRTDRELDNVADLRIGTVGLSGGFGSVTVGNQWSAFYDTVGTHIDPTYSLGYVLYSSVVAGPYRSSNTIKYSNSFGPVYLEADVRLNESGESSDVAERISGDGFGIGISVSATDNLTFAVALDSEEDTTAGGVATPGTDTDRVGAAVKLSTGGFFAMLGYQETEEDGGGTFEADQTQLWVGTTLGSTTLMLGIGEATANNVDTEQVVVGVYHNLGGGLKLYYEGTDVDRDAGDDLTIHYLGMRIDF